MFTAHVQEIQIPNYPAANLTRRTGNTQLLSFLFISFLSRRFDLDGGNNGGAATSAIKPLSSYGRRGRLPTVHPDTWRIWNAVMFDLNTKLKYNIQSPNPFQWVSHIGIFHHNKNKYIHNQSSAPSKHVFKLQKSYKKLFIMLLL